MKIGELGRRTGLTTKTIRYYEQIGLLPEPEREDNGYRDYPEQSVDRLTFVRDAQATGLTLAEIGSILDLRSQGEQTCHHVIELLKHHVDALDRHIATLQETRATLAGLTGKARMLDPADCHDPNRCQTIVDGIGRDLRRPHRVKAPTAHVH